MKVELKYRKEFEKILDGYRVSHENQDLLNETTLVLLRGASGSGRNAIIDELVRSGKYEDLVTDTTRPPRVKDGVPIEQDGVDYWFRSEEDVLEDLREGRFLEAEVIHEQQVSGISLRELAKSLKNQKISIADVHFGGVDSVKKEKPDTLVIFIVPPSMEEWIKRMTTRAEMSEQELKNRLNSSLLDIDHALDHDYYHFVINENVDEAASEIDALVSSGNRGESSNKAAKDLVIELKEQIKKTYFKA